jgi:molybdopterin-binding protein
MKLSARNKLKGKIIDVKKGATTAHVRLEIAPGQIVTASITNEAVEELGLKSRRRRDRDRQGLRCHDRGRLAHDPEKW